MYIAMGNGKRGYEFESKEKDIWGVWTEAGRGEMK